MTDFVHSGRGPVSGPPLDPDSTKTYGVAWDDWLNGRTIISDAWTATGLTTGTVQRAVSMTVDGVQYDAVNTVVLSGGTLGNIYTVTNQITDSDGNIVDRTMLIECTQL